MKNTSKPPLSRKTLQDRYTLIKLNLMLKTLRSRRRASAMGFLKRSIALEKNDTSKNRDKAWENAHLHLDDLKDFQKEEDRLCKRINRLEDKLKKQ